MLRLPVCSMSTSRTQLSHHTSDELSRLEPCQRRIRMVMTRPALIQSPQLAQLCRLTMTILLIGQDVLGTLHTPRRAMFAANVSQRDVPPPRKVQVKSHFSEWGLLPEVSELQVFPSRRSYSVAIDESVCLVESVNDQCALASGKNWNDQVFVGIRRPSS